MDLPPSWDLRESFIYPGRCYYFNGDTHESSWTRPIPYPGQATELPAIVYVYHILIRHAKSVFPDAPPMTRTPDEAKELIYKVWAEILTKSSGFDEVARIESEDPSTKGNGGLIGWIKRGQMPPQFDKMAFQLRVGEMSPPVETTVGWHLIRRKG